MKNALKGLVDSLKAKKLTQEQAVAASAILLLAAILLSALISGGLSSCISSALEAM